MAISSTQQTEILKVVAGLFNAAPGGSNLTELANFVAGGNSVRQMADALAAHSLFTNNIMAGKVTTDAQAAVLMNNFGLVADSTTTSAGSQALVYFKGAIDAKIGFGQIVYDAVTYLSGSPAAEFATAATLLANKALVAVTYSATTSSSDLSTLQNALSGVTGTAPYTQADVDAVLAGTGSTGGQTFALTTGADNPIATSKNDTISGLVDAATPANSTLTAADVINGLSGSGDALNITTQGGGAITDAVNSALVSNIEQVVLRATSTGGTALNMNNVAGATSINNRISTDAVTLTNVAGTTSLKITGNGSATNGATTATYAASATDGAVTFDSGVTAGAVAVNGAGFTSFTINSTGAANVTGAISSSGTSIATTTINATTAFSTTGLTVGTVAAGGQKLVITGAADETAATTTAAAGSAVVLGALDADYVSVDASGMTNGGVSATLSATTTTTFTGGAGDDRLTTSHSAHTGAINAGTGNDTLVLAASVDIDTAAEGDLYKGFEVLQANDAAALDMDLLTGSTVTAIVLNDGAGSTAITDMNATQGAAVRINALGGAATLGIKDATVVATADVLNITVSDGDTTKSEAIAGTGDLTIAGVETINVTATDDITLATMANITGLTKLTIAGDADVSVTTLVHAASANESIDFSGLTAASTFNFSGTTTNAIGFTGGSAADTVTDSVIGGNVITTKAGADSITLTDKTGGTSGDIITAGTGADTISFGTAEGQTAKDGVTFKFAAGDSVSTGTIVTDVTNADTISAIAWDDGGVATAGQLFTLDTEVSATAVTVGTTAAVFGTTTVTNAYDFFVKYTAASTDVYVYQDTDGDKIIESGEFAIKLIGDAAFVANNANDFSISSGNLVFTSNDAA